VIFLTGIPNGSPAATGLLVGLTGFGVLGTQVGLSGITGLIYRPGCAPKAPALRIPLPAGRHIGAAGGGAVAGAAHQHLRLVPGAGRFTGNRGAVFFRDHRRLDWAAAGRGLAAMDAIAR